MDAGLGDGKGDEGSTGAAVADELEADDGDGVASVLGAVRYGGVLRHYRLLVALRSLGCGQRVGTMCPLARVGAGLCIRH